MYNIERKIEIIKSLEKEGRVSAAELAKRFGTSKETIRRDLCELEEKGVLKRTHGGAMLSNKFSDMDSLVREYPESVRGIRNSEEKKALCKKAASFIQDGDIIFIDNSTTCLYLIPNIPAEYHVMILTNSLRLLTEAVNYDCTNKTFYCLGGSMNPSNLSTYDSAISSKDKMDFYPDKCIVSCMGVSSERMFTDGSYYEIGTKQKFMEQSSEVYLLADHTKIGTDGQFTLDSGEHIDFLITDEKNAKKKVKLSSNIKVITA